MISRKNDSSIKDLLYPDLNKNPLKNLIPKNYKQIKKIQEQNRIKKQKQLEKELNAKSKYIIFIIYNYLFRRTSK